jgi:hypothetical protein
MYQKSQKPLLLKGFWHCIVYAYYAILLKITGKTGQGTLLVLRHFTNYILSVISLYRQSPIMILIMTLTLAEPFALYFTALVTI